jgi:hypothetical protein
MRFSSGLAALISRSCRVPHCGQSLIRTDKDRLSTKNSQAWRRGVEFKPVNTVWMKNFAVFVKSNSEKETQASP